MARQRNNTSTRYDFNITSADVPLKEFWRNNERFAALFNDTLFQGEEYVRAKNLTEMDTEVSSTILTPEYQKILKRTRDVVKLSSDGCCYQILGIENQQAVHYAMPLRSLVYEMLGYLRQVEETVRKNREHKAFDTVDEFLSGWKKSDRLRPCYTIVIYWGPLVWDGPRSLADMMQFGPGGGWAESFRDYPGMHLLCANEFQEGQFHHKEVSDIFQTVSSLYQSGGRNMPDTLRDVSFDVAYTASAVTGTMKQYGRILQEAYRDRRRNVDMCEAVDRVLQEERRAGRQEGRQEGRWEGHREGRMFERKALALEMLRDGEAYEKIKKYTKLSEDEIKALEEEACAAV